MQTIYVLEDGEWTERVTDPDDFPGHTDGCTPGIVHRAADGTCPCECHRWRPGPEDD